MQILLFFYGRITDLARLSARPSLSHIGLLTPKQKYIERPKLLLTFFRAEVTGVPIYQFKGSKVKATRCQKRTALYMPALGVPMMSVLLKR